MGIVTAAALPDSARANVELVPDDPVAIRIRVSGRLPAVNPNSSDLPVRP